MLVKILDADLEFVTNLKRMTGAGTASKAYVFAAEQFPFLQAQIDQMYTENYNLTRQLAQANQVIDQARSAAKLLLEHASQSSLDV